TLSTPTLGFSRRRYRAGERVGDSSTLLRCDAALRSPRLRDRPACAPPAARGDSRAPIAAIARRRAAAKCGRPDREPRSHREVRRGGCAARRRPAPAKTRSDVGRGTAARGGGRRSATRRRPTGSYQVRAPPALSSKNTLLEKTGGRV